MHSLALTLAAAATLAFSNIASASVVLDWSPAATRGRLATTGYLTYFPSQYFAESVQFGSAQSINGMDIYSNSGSGSLGKSVIVSIWSDAAGRPGALAAQFSTTVTAVDAVAAYVGGERVHADFTSFTMAAATTYWIGMAGNSYGNALTQTGLSGVAGGNDAMWVSGSNWNGGGLYRFGDMAFRLHGTAVGNDVPEPGTLALLGIGLAGLTASRRRKAA